MKIGRRAFKTSALFGSLLLMGVVHAQTSLQPNPPPQICVNGKCVTTAFPTPSPAPGSVTRIKWNPGHYMASNNNLHNGDAISSTELNNLSPYQNVIGYRMFVYWQALQPTSPGVYDWTVIDNTLAALAAMSPQRHLVVAVLPGIMNFTPPLDGNAIKGAVPTYILNNSAYGPSPIAGSFGWWGGTGNGNTAVAALYRPAVMNEYIKLIQAMGARYDSNPLFEGVIFPETSWVIGASADNGATDYSDASFSAQIATWLRAATAAFPSTNVAVANTYLQYPTATQQLEQTLINGRALPSTADTYGESLAGTMSKLAWGIQAYTGVTASGSSYSGPDYRSETRFWADIQAPDLGAYGYTTYTPADILAGENQTYYSSHDFWTYLDSNSGAPASGQWAGPNGVAQFINNPANSLTHTAYPLNYP